MRTLMVGIREFRRDRLRSGLKVIFLTIALGFQLFTALLSWVSRSSVDAYAERVFGRAVTMQATGTEPMSLAEAMRVTETIARASQGTGVRQLVLTFSFDVDASQITGAQSDRSLSARALPPSMEPVAAVAVPFNGGGAPALHLTSGTLPVGTSMLLATEPADSGTSAAPPGASSNDQPTPVPTQSLFTSVAAGRDPLPAIVVDRPASRVKEFAADVLMDYDAALRLDPELVVVAAYWRADTTDANPASEVLEAAVRAAGVPGFDAPARVDERTNVAPLLDQQLRDARRFSTILLVICVAAVAAIEWTAAEAKRKRYTLFRCVGASRWAIGMVALVDNVVAAALAGCLVTVAGVVLLSRDPGTFNQFAEAGVEFTGSFPLHIATATLAVTLLVGVVSGLPAAIRSASGRLAFE